MAEEIKDFGFVEPTTIKFKLQGETYEANRRPPLGGLLALVDAQKSGESNATTLGKLMEITLTPASLKKFQKAMNATDGSTFDIAQLTAVTRWMMEELMARPTVSPDDSAD